MITNESIQRLKDSINIVDLISNYIPVHKNGANYMCVCPFHADKNPSMAVRENEGYFHCFGCGANGDAISFMQKYHNLEFIEAVKELANIYGFILEDDKKTKIIQNNDACKILNEYYISELNIRGNLIAYLEKRKITRDLRIKFNLGYAPSANDTLRILQKSNIALEQALIEGVVKKNDNGIYPSFIERITFPIYDNTGYLVGFGGRTLNPQNPAKYVNSPASKLFDKSSIFYAYHLAKNDINKHKRMIICEGYMDTISLHKAGLTYSVAVLGTALTEQHLKLIKKDCFVSLCFDKDAAGNAAAFKAGVLLSKFGYNAEVIRLKTYKDPGEYIENNEELKLKTELNNTINIISFCIEYIFKKELNLDYIDKLSISKIEPFLIKQAYSAVLNYTNTIDKFLANTHLKIFCENYGLDFDLLNGIKAKVIDKKPQTKQTQSNSLEDAIIYFLAISKANFNILILREYFHNNLIDDVLNKNYANANMLEFLNNIHPTKKVDNILVFFNNLANYYASCNILNALLFKNYAKELIKNHKLIHSNDGLKKAYHCLVELIANHNKQLSDDERARLKDNIRKLGE